MKFHILNSKVKVIEPIIEQDFQAAFALIEENLFKNDYSTMEEMRGASFGELLVAKKDDQVVGMLYMRRPGKIFEEIEDKYFSLKNYNVSKEKIGYIALVSVRKSDQGKGIGTKLLQRALVLQEEWGAKVICVHASKSSPGGASEKLFSKAGFTPMFLHEKPWYEYSIEKGPEGFWCNFCGNPCVCNELEMAKEL